MPGPSRILAVASTAGCALAFSASAQAATVTTLPCVPEIGQPGAKTMPIAGSGFTPGATVTIRTANKVAPTPAFLTTATADAAGNFAVTSTPASFNPFSRQEQSFALAAIDGTNPALGATVAYKQTRVSYRPNPSSGRPTTRALHTVRGLAVGKNVYLHFRFGGKTRRNVKLGKAKAPCGKVSRRMRLLPTRSRIGRWTVYADQSKSYRRSTTPQLKSAFTITRTYR